MEKYLHQRCRAGFYFVSAENEVQPRWFGVTSDRITQWLCLLKLPEEKRKGIEALGDLGQKDNCGMQCYEEL